MSKQYATKWPVPEASQQPPNRPLQSRRDDIREYECGLLFTPPPGTIAQATHSLLPSGFSGRIELDGADTAKASFADDRFEDDNTCVRIRVDIPFRDLLIDPQHFTQYADHSVPKLRPTEMGPILSVVHALDIALTCTYDMPEGEGEGVANGEEKTADGDGEMEDNQRDRPGSRLRAGSHGHHSSPRSFSPASLGSVIDPVGHTLGMSRLSAGGP